MHPLHVLHLLLACLLPLIAWNQATLTKTVLKRSNFTPLLHPPPGQRCSGRNYQGRRCCTPENPCDEGEGDCDGPGDGGGHDGNNGCKGDLVCGSNNCRQFGLYYHEKDDCCEKPTGKTCQCRQGKTEEQSFEIVPGTPL